MSFGAGVAVDVDHVERDVHRILAAADCQERLCHRRVGRDEAEHRRHVRVDHADALARHRRSSSRCRARRCASSRVSVVMIDFAKSMPPSGVSSIFSMPANDAVHRQVACRSRRSRRRRRRAGRCPASAPASCAIGRRCRSPACPVAALAQPELATTPAPCRPSGAASDHEQRRRLQRFCV